jgi:hypothetical protein
MPKLNRSQTSPLSRPVLALVLAFAPILSIGLVAPSLAQTSSYGMTGNLPPGPGNNGAPVSGLGANPGRPVSGVPSPTRPSQTYGLGSGLNNKGSGTGLRPGQPGFVSGATKPAPGQAGFVKGAGINSGANGNSSASNPARGNGGAEVGASGSACPNCATILQVRSMRAKATPSWMLSSDAQTPESSNSQNSERPTRGQGTSIGTGGNRSLVNPDGAGAQFGKRVYEVTLMMDSGLTRKIQLDLMPAYNLGSRVRVMGNRLSPT